MSTLMTSAKERAVEAGARSDAAFDGRSWEALSRAERERYLARARKSQGAAFPILSAELVRDAEAGVAMLKAAGASDDGVRGANAIALSLRARIQQMAEAL